ncbi:MAG: hypothetical protein EP319_13430 [Deltaproteobacteria bacterium]|nr:MAG: hypothetical protein EP319_13430 [Deltaproteobacteria bacterium]
MKKLITLIAALFTLSSFAADFTPDHFEGIWSGASRSEDIPEYCKIVGDRIESEGEVSLKLSFEYKGDKLVSFNAPSKELKSQLTKQGSFVILKNKNEHVQVNISGFKILNFTYQKADDSGKIVRMFTCSNR